MKLAALGAVLVLFVMAGYVYLYGDPTVRYRCEWAARDKFGQIALDNSRPLQNDWDKSTGQEGAGREILKYSPAFKIFVGHMAESACICVEEKIKSTHSTPRDRALRECIEELRSDPMKALDYLRKGGRKLLGSPEKGDGA